MPAITPIDRERWLGHRWHRHGLAGDAGRPVLDDLLLLGFQSSRQFGPEASLLQRAAKIGRTAVTDAVTVDGPVVTTWSVRGAPHAHRADQLDTVRDALAPQETDEGGQAFIDAVDEVAEAIAAVVTGPTTKSDVSTQVAKKVSSRLVSWCPRCKADHVGDGVFRAAGRQAQIVVGPEEQRATVLYPKPGVKQEPVKEPRLALLRAYLAVNGPSTKALFQSWTEGTGRTVGDLWDGLGDLVRVQVDGKRYDLPADQLDDVTSAPDAQGVALVPPNDPYLKQVDRTLLMPDSSRRKEVYKSLSGPGALLVDGEVAGTWRYRRTEHELTVSAFGTLAKSRKAQVEEAAAKVTRSVGDDEPTVTFG